jgi:hypothetical protein
MAKEVLVNDGGAPARILPFVSAATGSAGDPITINTAGKTIACAVGFKVAGFLLTDVDAVGDMANVVMGHGCMLNVTCKADVEIGDVLQSGLVRLDGVVNSATIDFPEGAVAIALEAGDTATDLPIKVLVL